MEIPTKLTPRPHPVLMVYFTEYDPARAEDVRTAHPEVFGSVDEAVQFIADNKKEWFSSIIVRWTDDEGDSRTMDFRYQDEMEDPWQAVRVWIDSYMAGKCHFAKTVRKIQGRKPGKIKFPAPAKKPGRPKKTETVETAETKAAD